MKSCHHDLFFRLSPTEIRHNVGYAQLGLKVSQLSYACKEMGLSDETAERITSAYGKQAEEKINKVNSMIEFAAKQVKIEQAMAGFRDYFVSDPIENYNGTDREQRQLDELLKRFNNFI